jgi:hypothetical protein
VYFMYLWKQKGDAGSPTCVQRKTDVCMRVCLCMIVCMCADKQALFFSSNF